MKSIQNLIASQLKSKEKPISTPLSVENVDDRQDPIVFKQIDLDDIFVELGEKGIKAVNFIVFHWDGKVCGSDAHSYIALKSGCSISTVQRTLKYLERKGVIGWDYIHMRPNNYFLSPQLLELDFKRKLQRTMQFLGVFALCMLTSIRASDANDRHFTKSFNSLNTHTLIVSNVGHSRGTLSSVKKSESFALTSYKQKLLTRITKVPDRLKLIDEHIRTKMALSTRDITQLCKYNMGTLNEAVRWLPHCLKADNPLAALFDRCNKIANKNSWLIDHDLANRLTDALGACSDERWLNTRGYETPKPVHFDTESQPCYKPTPQSPPARPGQPAAAPTKSMYKAFVAEPVVIVDENQERANWWKIKASMLDKYGINGAPYGSMDYFLWTKACKMVE